jgi:hypothetical protein
VGQLSFSDFVATAEFTNDLVFAGNADLVPQTAWLYEAVLERRFWGRGAAIATFRHRELQDVIDFVPIDRRFEAPGNLGDGRSDELLLNLTLPLDKLGVAGGLIRGNLGWRISEVIDPLTGESRRISGQRPYDGNIAFSQDLAAKGINWGFNLNNGWTETYYRLGELSRTELTWWGSAFVEYKPSPVWSFRAEYTDLDAYVRDRILYEGARGSGPIRFTEERVIPPPYRLNLRVRRALG